MGNISFLLLRPHIGMYIYTDLANGLFSTIFSINDIKEKDKHNTWKNIVH